MTLLQITQFIGGLGISHYILYTVETYSIKQSFAMSFTVTYVSIVLSMFCSFFYDTYFGKKEVKTNVVREDAEPIVESEEKQVTPRVRVRRTPRKKE
jgi:phosphotransferase system  glucose/maltose/N-acetylglucosamine-specific IIC component